LPARARLLEPMGMFAGKWLHSLAFQLDDVGGPLEQALIGTRYRRRRRTLGRYPARRALVRSLDRVHRALSGLSRGGGNFVVA
jgi:hypothetical protein